MNLPTKITVSRLFMIPIMIACFCMQDLWEYMFIITCAIFFVASTTDFIDGYIARKYNMVTSLGKFLDPIADKVLVVSGIFLVICGGYVGIPFLAMICGIIIVAREFIIGLFRQMAALKNFVLSADKLGKYKTFSTMLAVGSLMLVPIEKISVTNAAQITSTFFQISGTALLIIATLLTVWSGVNYIIKNKSILKDNDGDEKTNDKTEEKTEI